MKRTREQDPLRIKRIRDLTGFSEYEKSQLSRIRRHIYTKGIHSLHPWYDSRVYPSNYNIRLLGCALVHAYTHSTNIMCVLLNEWGANPNQKDCNRYTPFHFAARYGAPEVIDLLMEKGAKVGAEDWITPHHPAVLLRLLRHGLPCTLPDSGPCREVRDRVQLILTMCTMANRKGIPVDLIRELFIYI